MSSKVTAGKPLPFTPFKRGEQRLVDEYLRRAAKDPMPGTELAELLDELEVAEDRDLGYRRLDIAAGKIIASYIDVRTLPNWTFHDTQEGWTTFREHARGKGVQRHLLNSRELLTINWASSGLGLGWPEQYRVSWLPTPGRFVVTGSFETDEERGYADIAIGHFPIPDGPVMDKVRPIILREWRLVKGALMQPPWESVVSSGLVSEEQALAWCRLVWPRDPEYYQDQWA